MRYYVSYSVPIKETKGLINKGVIMNLMRLSRLTALLPAIYLLFSTSAYAGAESGFYVGGSIGNANISAKGETPGNIDFDFSESDSGYKIFAGYNFGIIPLIDIAVEGSYVDFGKPTGTASDGSSIKYEMTAWDGFGLVGLTFGPFALFGKVGVVAWDSESAIGAITGSDSGTDPAYGIGVKFQIASFAIRAEYERFDLNNFDDVYMASVGAAYTF